MPLLDILVVLIILGSVFFGLVRGFLKTTVRFSVSILSLGLALLLTTTVASLFIDVLGLDSYVANVLSSSLSQFFVSSTGGPLDNTVLHEFAQLTLGQEYWLNYAGGVENVEFIALLSYSAATSLITLVSFLVTYTFLRIILGLIAALIRPLNRKRAFGWIARGFGGLVGLFESLVSILILLCIFHAFIPLAPGVGEGFLNLLNSNPITSWFYSLTHDLMQAIISPWLLGLN